MTFPSTLPADSNGPPDPPPRDRRWWATRVGIPTVVGIAAIGLGAAAIGSGDSNGASGSTANTTATVERRTIVERETFDGTLGYDDPRAVTNKLTGTLTRVPVEGATISRGGILYRVDNSPVVLMYGSTPAYRTMGVGDEGPDVEQLERNLGELGYDPDGDIGVDGDFDSATEAAVLDWQEDRGLDETGRVDLGRVVFLSGARRVGEVRLELGSILRSGQQVMGTTSTRRAVTVSLDARRQDLVKVGDRERVTLPGGRQVNATVSAVGAVATASTPGDDPAIDVTLVLASSNGVTALDSAPVDVEITKRTKANVLTVPVIALLAVDGGFGVEVEDPSGSRTVVAVETGLFADSYVEVSGVGIAEGTRVVVPA